MGQRCAVRVATSPGMSDGRISEESRAAQVLQKYWKQRQQRRYEIVSAEARWKDAFMQAQAAVRPSLFFFFFFCSRLRLVFSDSLAIRGKR